MRRACPEDAICGVAATLPVLTYETVRSGPVLAAPGIWRLLNRLQHVGFRSGKLPGRLLLSLLVVMWLVAGCGGKAVLMDLVASPTLNADDSGSGLPVVVRIYQLHGKDRLEQADFASLWKADRDVLQDDLISRQEVTVHPNSTVPLSIDRSKKPEFLAVMALFRKPEGTSWRQVIPLQGQKVRFIEIRLGDRGIDAAALN